MLPYNSTFILTNSFPSQLQAIVFQTLWIIECNLFVHGWKTTYQSMASQSLKAYIF